MFQSEVAVFITKAIFLPSGDRAGFSYCAAAAASAQPKEIAANCHGFGLARRMFCLYVGQALSPGAFPWRFRLPTDSFTACSAKGAFVPASPHRMSTSAVTAVNATF